MNKADRAKQFMPFDALKGLQEELRAREERRSRVEKKDLSEEQIEAICQVLNKVRQGSRIGITFYQSGHYLSIEGTVTENSEAYHYLKVGNARIYYDDIYKIRIT